MHAALRLRALCILCSLCVLCFGGRDATAQAQEPPRRRRLGRRSCRPRSTSSAISTTTRGPAPRARSVAPRATQAVPALLQAVAEHRDGYVRYRALVLLTGFNDPRTQRRHSRVAEEPERSPADGGLQLSRAQTRIARCSRTARGAGDRAGRVRQAGADPRAGRSRRRSARSERARPRGRPRRGFLPQRGDRGARRLQGAATRSTRSPRWRCSKARCRTTPRSRSGRSATSERSKFWPACSAPRRGPTQPTVAAAICLLGVNCESHENYLIQTLRFADANPGISGAPARVGGRSRRPRRRRPTRRQLATLLRGRHPVARSHSRAGRAGGGDHRAPQYAR